MENKLDERSFFFFFFRAKGTFPGTERPEMYSNIDSTVLKHQNNTQELSSGTL